MVVAGGGVTNFKLGSLFIHPFPTCCTNFFKHGRYSYRINAFI